MAGDQCPVCKGPVKFYKGDGDSQWCETLVKPGQTIISREQFKDALQAAMKDYLMMRGGLIVLLERKLFGG